MAVNSVRKKFLAILLPLFIVSFIVISGLIYYMAGKTLDADNDRIAKNISQQVASNIGAEVEKTLLPLKTGSHNPVFAGNSDEQQKLQALAEIKSDDPSMAETFFTSLSGDTLRGDGKHLDRGDREYFKKAVESQKPYIAEPFMGSTSNKLMTMVVQPIKVNDELRGLLMASVNIEDLAKNIDKFKVSDNGYTYITDEAGTVIGFAQKPELEGKMNIAKGSIDGSDEKVDAALVEAFNGAVKNNTQNSVYFKDSDGIKCFSVITPFELAGNVWAVVTVAPVSEINAPIYAMLKSIAIVVIIVLAAAILVIFRFSKSVAYSLGLLLEECNKINDGIISDGKLMIHRNDEIGKLADGFTVMKKTLRSLVSTIQIEAEQVSASSEELTANSDQYSQIAEQTAASVSEIAQGSGTQASSAQEIHNIAADMSKDAASVAEKTRTIADNAAAARNNVDDNSSIMKKVVEQMNDIAENTKQIEASIQKLDSSSQKIGDILKLIINISEETNLLALNAAIEAARAGEAGKGFAVVAEQVRKLAEETGSSTKQITQLIENNQADIEVVVRASRSGSQSVSSGIGTVESANEVFGTVVENIDRLAQEILEVSGSIEKMTDKTEIMLKASLSINDISSENAQETDTVAASIQQQSASIKEIASASRNLSELACNLQEKVQHFRI